MADTQGKRPSLRAQGDIRRAIDSPVKPSLKTRTSGRRTTPKSSHRKRKPSKTERPGVVVMREGKTTIRQLRDRRFVSFGEFRGKRVAQVQFYTCGPSDHSIGIHFLDQTVFYLVITRLFAIKPEYCSFKSGDLETIKEWPEMKCER